MSFREVQVHEIREVLRLWLRGEGQRAVARLSAVDRKTVRRYIDAGLACGLLLIPVMRSAGLQPPVIQPAQIPRPPVFGAPGVGVESQRRLRGSVGAGRARM